VSRDSHELIYVIAGKEQSLVGAQCGKLLDNLLEPSQRTTGLFDADAGSVTAAEVLDDLRTLPFLTDKRVVLIRDADDFVSDHRSLLEKYFDNPCPTGRLILVVKTWNKSTKLAKKLPKVGKLISVAQPSRKELPRRIIDYANDAHGKKITYGTAQLLIELTGDDLTRLYSEVDKLALYADADKTIAPKHIEALIGHNRLFSAFAVIDAVIAGTGGRASQGHVRTGQVSRIHGGRRIRISLQTDVQRQGAARQTNPPQANRDQASNMGRYGRLFC